MVTRVEWTLDGLRELTIWIAGFVQNEVGLRATRSFILDDVRHALLRCNGEPEGGYSLAGERGDIMVWEYIGRTIWLVFHREDRRPSFWRRWFGDIDREVLIVTAMRRAPTPQELKSLHK